MIQNKDVPYTVQNNTVCFPAIYNDTLNHYHNIINGYKSLKYDVPFYKDSGITFDIPFNTTNIELIGGYNRPTILTPNLTHVKLGICFSQNIILSKNIKHFDWDIYPTKQLVLPKTLEHLILGYCDNYSWIALNKNLITFKIFLSNLQLSHGNERHIRKKSHMIISKCPTIVLNIVLNKKLRECHVPQKTDHQVILSKNLLCIHIDFVTWNGHLGLPKHIKKVKLSGKIDKPFILTPHITHLILNNIYLKTFIVGNSISVLDINNCNKSIVENLPDSIKLAELPLHIPNCEYNFPRRIRTKLYPQWTKDIEFIT